MIFALKEKESDEMAFSIERELVLKLRQGYILPISSREILLEM